MAITETWLIDSIFDSEILPSGFSIYRRDRGSTGGGVLLAISSAIPSCLLLSAPDIELVVVKLILPKPIVIGCAYLPPSPSSLMISSSPSAREFEGIK